MNLFFKNLSYKNFSQEELIKSAQKDDLRALEELIKREQRNIYATLYYMNDNNTDILDNTQEVLYKMTKNIKNLKNPKAFKSWLNRIILHLHYDNLRKNLKKPTVLPLEKKNDNNNENDVFYETLAAELHKRPEETTLNKELNNVITDAIKTLPKQLKIAIILREFHGLSYEEIANITEVNIGTVKSRIARARNKLQENLKSYVK